MAASIWKYQKSIVRQLRIKACIKKQSSEYQSIRIDAVAGSPVASFTGRHFTLQHLLYSISCTASPVQQLLYSFFYAASPVQQFRHSTVQRFFYSISCTFYCIAVFCTALFCIHALLATDVQRSGQWPS